MPLLLVSLRLLSKQKSQTPVAQATAQVNSVKSRMVQRKLRSNQKVQNQNKKKTQPRSSKI